MVGAPGDAVAIAILGIHPLQDLRFRYLFQQAGTDHGRSDARRDLGARRKGTISQLLEDIAGFEQGIGFSIREGPGQFSMIDAYCSLGGDSVNRKRIQIATIRWLRTRRVACARP